jgi:hypothetical protein
MLAWLTRRRNVVLFTLISLGLGASAIVFVAGRPPIWASGMLLILMFGVIMLLCGQHAILLTLGDVMKQIITGQDLQSRAIDIEQRQLELLHRHTVTMRELFDLKRKDES